MASSVVKKSWKVAPLRNQTGRRSERSYIGKNKDLFSYFPKLPRILSPKPDVIYDTDVVAAASNEMFYQSFENTFYGDREESVSYGLPEEFIQSLHLKNNSNTFANEHYDTRNLTQNGNTGGVDMLRSDVFLEHRGFVKGRCDAVNYSKWEDWRRPGHPVPVRPDFSRSLPSYSKQHGSNSEKQNTSVRNMQKPIPNPEDVSFIAESLRSLPRLLHSDTHLDNDTFYLPQYAQSVVMGKRYLTATEVRQRRYIFPGFCAGCLRAGLCYGCDKYPTLHYHVDQEARDGGGFPYFTHAHVQNERNSRNLKNWKLIPIDGDPDPYDYTHILSEYDMDETVLPNKTSFPASIVTDFPSYKQGNIATCGMGMQNTSRTTENGICIPVGTHGGRTHHTTPRCNKKIQRCAPKYHESSDVHQTASETQIQNCQNNSKRVFSGVNREGIKTLSNYGSSTLLQQTLENNVGPLISSFQVDCNKNGRSSDTSDMLINHDCHGCGKKIEAPAIIDFGHVPDVLLPTGRDILLLEAEGIKLLPLPLHSSQAHGAEPDLSVAKFDDFELISQNESGRDSEETPGICTQAGVELPKWAAVSLDDNNNTDDDDDDYEEESENNTDDVDVNASNKLHQTASRPRTEPANQLPTDHAQVEITSQSRPRHRIIAKLPFSTNRRFSISSKPDFEVKKCTKALTQFVEFKTSPAEWKQPKRFVIQKASRPVTVFITPPIRKKKKVDRFPKPLYQQQFPRKGVHEKDSLNSDTSYNWKPLSRNGSIPYCTSQERIMSPLQNHLNEQLTRINTVIANGSVLENQITLRDKVMRRMTESDAKVAIASFDEDGKEDAIPPTRTSRKLSSRNLKKNLIGDPLGVAESVQYIGKCNQEDTDLNSLPSIGEQLRKLGILPSMPSESTLNDINSTDNEAERQQLKEMQEKNKTCDQGRDGHGQNEDINKFTNCHTNVQLRRKHIARPKYPTRFKLISERPNGAPIGNRGMLLIGAPMTDTRKMSFPDLQPYTVTKKTIFSQKPRPEKKFKTFFSVPKGDRVQQVRAQELLPLEKTSSESQPDEEENLDKASSECAGSLVLNSVDECWPDYEGLLARANRLLKKKPQRPQHTEETSPEDPPIIYSPVAQPVEVKAEEETLPPLPIFELPPLPEYSPPVYYHPERPRKMTTMIQLHVSTPPEVQKKRKPPPKVRRQLKVAHDRRSSRHSDTGSVKQEAQIMVDPLLFLEKYCIINPDKLPFYEKIFNNAINAQSPKYPIVSEDESAILPDRNNSPRSNMDESNDNDSPHEEESRSERSSYSHAASAKHSMSSHEVSMISDFSVINRSMHATMARTPSERSLEKVKYAKGGLIERLKLMKLQLKDIDARRNELLADKARELFPEVASPKYTANNKKSKKSGKSAKSVAKSAASSHREVLFNAGGSKASKVHDSSPFKKSRAEQTVTDELILSRLNSKMMDELLEFPEISHLDIETEMVEDKIDSVKERVDQLEVEKSLLLIECRDLYITEETRDMRSPEFMRRQSAKYKRLHPCPDKELNIEEVESGLQIINNNLLTQKEFQYIFQILNLPGIKRVNFHLFSILAALSEKVVQLDPFIRKLINKMDYEALDVKLAKCKELFALLQDGEYMPEGLASAHSLSVELIAGRLRPEHVAYIMEKFNRDGRGIIDFLDFVTYIPLFVEIHQRIIQDPLKIEPDLWML